MIRTLIALFLTSQLLGPSWADNCYDLVDTYCSDIVPFDVCAEVECIDNSCPPNTYQYTPTSDSFSDFVQPAYEAPYETFSLITSYNCRCKTLSDTCNPGQLVDACENSVNPYTDPDHPNVSADLIKPVVQGEDSCWFY